MFLVPMDPDSFAQESWNGPDRLSGKVLKQGFCSPSKCDGAADGAADGAVSSFKLLSHML